MKRVSVICVLMLALAAIGGRAQSFCFQADNGEAWVSISETEAQFRNCSNGNLPIDELSTTGSLTVSGCAVSYTGTQGAYTLSVVADTCANTATVRLFKGETEFYSFSDSNTADSNCVCP